MTITAQISLTHSATEMSTPALVFALRDLRQDISLAEDLDFHYGTNRARSLTIKFKTYRAELQSRGLGH